MTTRRTLGSLAALLPLVGLLVVGALLAPKIGPVMASHWSGGSTPDDYSSTWASFWIFAGVAAAISALGVVLVVRLRSGGAARLYGGIATLTGALVAGGWVMSALATVQATTPARAVLGANWFVLLAAPVLAAVVVLLVPSGPRAGADGRLVEPLPLGANERVAWSGVTGSAPFLTIGLVIAAGGVVGGIAILAAGGPPAELVVVAVVIIAGLASLLLARVRLTVDQRGVRLVSALFGVPLMRIPLASIESVEAETIDPLRWGGWGYRFSPSGRAYVTRRSGGLVVTNRAGFASAVTIEDAATAASVIQTLIDRYRTPSR